MKLRVPSTNSRTSAKWGRLFCRTWAARENRPSTCCRRGYHAPSRGDHGRLRTTCLRPASDRAQQPSPGNEHPTTHRRARPATQPGGRSSAASGQRAALARRSPGSAFAGVGGRTITWVSGSGSFLMRTVIRRGAGLCCRRWSRAVPGSDTGARHTRCRAPMPAAVTRDAGLRRRRPSHAAPDLDTNPATREAGPRHQPRSPATPDPDTNHGHTRRRPHTTPDPCTSAVTCGGRRCLCGRCVGSRWLRL